MKLIKSFGYAGHGLITLIREEQNARIHVLAAVVVGLAGYYFSISSTEWMFILLAIALVIGAELFNTAIENLADVVSPEKNIHIKRVKDLAAGGVLVCALFAVCIGLIIFLPKLIA